MSLDQKAIITQIDDILARYQLNPSNSLSPESLSTMVNILFSAIQRLAPPGSVYARNIKNYENYLKGSQGLYLAVEPLRGILRALRHDYVSGYLESVVELVHADVFSDFLDMADYLAQQGYKDAAAVIAGSVLEEHLRKLCAKNSIDVLKPDGSPKKADALNSELAAASVYAKIDQKNVTHLLGIRNDAAHGNYSAYTQEQVNLMIQSVRDFASRYPA
jgi:uncharacterized protein (DUF2164 family)